MNPATADLLPITKLLLENAAMPVLAVLFYAWLRERIGGMSRWRREPIEGLVCGVIALLSIGDPIGVGTGVQVDARYGLIVLAAMFGGPFAGLIAVAMAVSYRWWLGGAGAVTGAGGLIVAIVICLAMRWRLAARKRELRYRDLMLLAVAVSLGSSVVAFATLPRPAAIILRQTELPFLIVDLISVAILGGLVLWFDRARAVARQGAESDARLRSIVDHLPDLLSIKDRAGRFLFVNKSYEQNSGFTAAELIDRPARTVWDKVGGPPSLEQDAALPWQTGASVRSPPVAITVGGRRVWVVVTNFPIRNAEGEIGAVGTITTDVTELIVAREALERREAMLRRHQQAMTDIVRAGAALRPFAEDVRALVEIGAEALGVERTLVFDMDYDTGRARCLDEYELGARRHGTVPDTGIDTLSAGTTELARERVLAIDDAMADPRLAHRRDTFRRHGIASVILVAVHVGSDMRGLISFNHVGAVRAWSTEEIAFARQVGSLLSVMFVTSRYRESLAALDLVGDAIYVERDDGRVIYANRPALDLARAWGRGARPDGARGLVSLAFPRPEQPLLAERDRGELTWRRGDDAKELDVRRVRLPEGGTVSVIADVTQAKRDERERAQLELKLRDASRMEAVGQLAGGIAHDFNNLLGAIIGFARFLEQDLTPRTEPHRYATRILEAGERGKTLVAQILGFAQARSLEKHPLDLRLPVEENCRLIADTLPPGIELSLDLGAAPLPVLGNEGQLGQVILNLCINARDALAATGGCIGVALARLSPGDPDLRRAPTFGRLDPARGYARLEVSDNGAGIAPEFLPRIFEPFFTTKGGGRGTGLGLAIVQGIVTAHDGACAVDSIPGAGTRIAIYLPLGPGLAAVSRPAPADAALRGHERLLIVDDEIDITDVLSIGLDRLGYEVAAVNTPHEALEAFAEAPEQWDFVVTDQLMAGLSGLALAERLLAIRPDVAIILCTGLDDGTVAPAAHALGIRAVLAKPVEPERLAAAIRAAARKPAAVAQHPELL